jgi:hypothetical protein
MNTITRQLIPIRPKPISRRRRQPRRESSSPGSKPDNLRRIPAARLAKDRRESRSPRRKLRKCKSLHRTRLFLNRVQKPANRHKRRLSTLCVNVFNHATRSTPLSRRRDAGESTRAGGDPRRRLRHSALRDRRSTVVLVVRRSLATVAGGTDSHALHGHVRRRTVARAIRLPAVRAGETTWRPLRDDGRAALPACTARPGICQACLEVHQAIAAQQVRTIGISLDRMIRWLHAALPAIKAKVARLVVAHVANVR